jgi:GTP-binding protein HflX
VEQGDVDLLIITGHTSGINKEILRQLEELGETTYPRDLLISSELAAKLAVLTEKTRKELAVYLDRYGRIRQMMVGNDSTVPLNRKHLRRNSTHLAGVRCVHTHPGGSTALSELDLAALEEYRLDAMAAIGVQNGLVTGIEVAFLGLTADAKGDTAKYSLYGPFAPEELVRFPYQDILRETEKRLSGKKVSSQEKKAEKTLLITFKQPPDALVDEKGTLLELEELAISAGAEVAGKMILNLTKPDPRQYLGKGKAQEIAFYRQLEAIDLVIIDDELSPHQQYNLEENIGCRVLDRTALILQIFADRARTKEGILQVELAQLNYLLPRLTGHGTSLSRLGGGIGTKGPGETKLEVDRRRIRKRIADLQEEIEEIKKQRAVLRQNRTQNEVPVVALVGYTNAGKSTLMNTLTDAGVYAEDKLFATLDTTTRRLKLKQGEVLLSDTVGFINKLPHTLIAAFRATLEEINYADLLLHVVDAGNAHYQAQIQAVRQVLEELEVLHKPTVLVFNKWDTVADRTEILSYIGLHNPALPVSALDGYNIPELLEMIQENLPDPPLMVTMFLPYEEASLLDQLYKQGEILQTEYQGDGILCTASLRSSRAAKYRKYFCGAGPADFSAPGPVK